METTPPQPASGVPPTLTDGAFTAAAAHTPPTSATAGGEDDGTAPPPAPTPGLPRTPTSTEATPAAPPRPPTGATTDEADDGTTPPTPPTLHLVSAGVSLPTVTLGAAAVLADADVVLYDDLARHALPLVRPGATLIPVGKRGGAASSTPQAAISALAAAAAKATIVRAPPAATAGYVPTASRVGVRRAVVVRLKAGDAGVFGRAAEEVAAVAAAGVAVTVLPGVCSVTAAAVAAGVPLTVKGVSDGFTVASGHAPDRLDWPVLGRADTLVLLMATRELVTIADRLVRDGGRDAATPLAVLGDGGGRVWRGTLAEVAGGAPAPAAAADDKDGIPRGGGKGGGWGAWSPAVVVVGEVARYANEGGRWEGVSL